MLYTFMWADAQKMTHFLFKMTNIIFHSVTLGDATKVSWVQRERERIKGEENLMKPTRKALVTIETIFY